MDSRRRPTDEERQQAYDEMGAALADDATLEHVAARAATHVMLLLDAQGATVTRLEGEDLRYIACVGTTSRLSGRAIPVHDSFTGQVVTSGEPAIFDPSSAPAASSRRALGDNVGSGLVAPILVSARPVGTIGVVSAGRESFDEVDLRTLRDFALFVAFRLQQGA